MKLNGAILRKNEVSDMVKTLFVLIFAGLLACLAGQSEKGTSISVIGEADGPTSIFLAGKSSDIEDHLSLKVEDNENEGIAFLPLGVYLRPIAYENGQLKVEIDNQCGSDYYYGMDYALQKKDGENWIDVEPVVEYGWPKISLMVKDTEKATEEYDLTVFGDLEAGSYKLVKNELEAEFTLEETS